MDIPSTVVTIKDGFQVLVDLDDLQNVERIKWHVQWRYKNGEKDYITCVRCTHNGSPIWLHRMIMSAPKGMIVDHINGDVLDNRKANLRLCTENQNRRNRKISRTNKSGYKGVYRVKGSVRTKQWRAEIQVNGKQIHLGSFVSPEAAYESYVEASRKHHGTFGRVERRTETKADYRPEPGVKAET